MGMLRALALIGMGTALAGCGLVPALAERTTAAALAPVARTAQATAAAARATAASVQVIDRTVTRSASQISQSSTQLSRSINQASANAASYRRLQQATRQASYAPPRNSRGSKTSKIAKTKPPAEPELTVLPAETLALLTPDQAGLQKAAQTEAFTAPIGEMIYWEIEGRSGSAMAESESAMGSFQCRTFVQTVTIDGVLQEGNATACRTDSGLWTSSF